MYIHKLILFTNKTPTFDCLFLAECRAVLTPMITMQVKQLMDKREELKTCAEVLSELLDTLHRKDIVSHSHYLIHNIEKYVDNS